MLLKKHQQNQKPKQPELNQNMHHTDRIHQQPVGRKETVEEFLQRGGKIKKINRLGTIGIDIQRLERMVSKFSGYGHPTPRRRNQKRKR